MRKGVGIICVLIFGSIAIFPQEVKRRVLDESVSNIRMSVENSSEVLSEVATLYHLKLSIEFPIIERITRKSDKPIVIENGTVRDVLKVFVEINPQLEWNFDGNTISLFPKEISDRESILALTVSKFTAEKLSLGAVSRRLLQVPEVLRYLQKENLVSNDDSTAFDVVPLKTISFAARCSTLREILDQLLADDKIQYWAIYRNTGSRRYVRIVLR